MVQVEALVTLVRSCQKRGGGLDRAKVDAIRERLEQGADAGRPDNSGTTAVHEALDRGEPEVLRLLLTTGPVERLKLSRDKNGQTPLVSLVRKLANPSYAQRVPEAALWSATPPVLSVSSTLARPCSLGHASSSSRVHSTSAASGTRCA